MLNQPEYDCIHHIRLFYPNKFPLHSKSIGKWLIQSDSGIFFSAKNKSVSAYSQIALFKHRQIDFMIFAVITIQMLFNFPNRFRDNLVNGYFKRVSTCQYLTFSTRWLFVRERVVHNFPSVTLTHLCRPVRSTFAVRETVSLGIMGEPRVPPLNPSETIVL